MGDEVHKLFLFEFLVHSVNYYNSTLKLDFNFLKSLGPTCVQLKAKNLPPLMVSEIDFCSKGGFNSSHVKFKSGKSCLFSFGNKYIDDCDIKAEVSVKRKVEEENNYYCLGKGNFCMNNKFVNVLNSSGVTPTSQCLKLCLDVKNSLNETVCNVFLLVRLTCFGAVIITEFQKSPDDASAGFLFKGDKILPLEPEQSACTGIRRDSKYISGQKEITRDQMEQMKRISQQYGQQQMMGQMQPQMMQQMPYPMNNGGMQMNGGGMPPMNMGMGGNMMMPPSPCPTNYQQQYQQPPPFSPNMNMGQPDGYYMQPPPGMMYPPPQQQQQQQAMMQCPPGCYPGNPGGRGPPGGNDQYGGYC